MNQRTAAMTNTHQNIHATAVIRSGKNRTTDDAAVSRPAFLVRVLALALALALVVVSIARASGRAGRSSAFWTAAWSQLPGWVQRWPELPGWARRWPASSSVPPTAGSQGGTLTQLTSLADGTTVKLACDQSGTGSPPAPLAVEVVTSAQGITQGLSGRSEIGRDGMLFVLPRRQSARFWMKDMQFDLDLVWIDRDHVIGVTPNVPKPKPGQMLGQLPTYEPPAPVTMVLELPAGQAAAHQLTLGARCVFTQP